MPARAVGASIGEMVVKTNPEAEDDKVDAVAGDRWCDKHVHLDVVAVDVVVAAEAGEVADTVV